MLTIRGVHTEPFKSAARERFVDTLKQRLTETLPDSVAALGPEAFEQRISSALERATALGLGWESSLAAFVRLSLQVGPHFTEFPAVRALLAGPEGTPDERMQRAVTEVTSEQWAEAAHDEQALPWDAIDASRREG
ncbi:hypothetical protein ACLESO_21615 [Pyxidicoccus sp. 3LG]